MSQLPLTSDLARIFLDDVPLIDLRAPIEFKEGAFPCSTSLPLMTDDERAQVGTCFKQRGQAAAIELGHQLVGGAVRAERLDGWLAQLRKQPDALLYCFRGGLRSQTVQLWLHEAGVTRPRVAGGYKEMRRFLIDTLDKAAAECHWTVLTGMTGSGKTHMLEHVTQAVDLEGHAHHRGSSFGQLPGGQPSNINFENNMAIELLKRRHQGEHAFVVEDESRLIGRCCLPLSLHEAMSQAPLVVVDVPQIDRAEQIRDSYGVRVLNNAEAAAEAVGELGGVGKFAVDQEVGGFDKTAFFGELRDVIAAVAKYAFFAIDEGDGAFA